MKDVQQERGCARLRRCGHHAASGGQKALDINRTLIWLAHHPPQLPSRPPSTHTLWSGRGSWRPCGARHCMNHQDARGRVCSALPGATVDGMGAPCTRHYGPAVGNGAPTVPVPADPPPEASSCARE